MTNFRLEFVPRHWWSEVYQHPKGISLHYSRNAGFRVLAFFAPLLSSPPPSPLLLGHSKCARVSRRFHIFAIVPMHAALYAYVSSQVHGFRLTDWWSWSVDRSMDRSVVSAAGRLQFCEIAI